MSCNLLCFIFAFFWQCCLWYKGEEMSLLLGKYLLRLKNHFPILRADDLITKIPTLISWYMKREYPCLAEGKKQKFNLNNVIVLLSEYCRWLLALTELLKNLDHYFFLPPPCNKVKNQSFFHLHPLSSHKVIFRDTAENICLSLVP